MKWNVVVVKSWYSSRFVEYGLVDESCLFFNVENGSNKKHFRTWPNLQFLRQTEKNHTIQDALLGNHHSIHPNFQY